MPFNKETASKAGKKSSRKDTPNKSTTEMREMFRDLLEANMPKIQKDLNALEPVERLKVLLDLAKFVIPVLKSSEIKADVGMRIKERPIFGQSETLLEKK